VTSTLYAAARMVTPDGVVSPARVLVEDGTIVAVGSAPPEGRGPADAVDLGDVTLVPGFVDIHAHGGGGAAFVDGPAAAAEVAATHLAHGTTTMVASLVTDAVDRLEEQVAALRPMVEAGDLAGVHLEGPWLSDRHAGAHDTRLLRDPTRSDIDRLLHVGGGTVVVVTLAVERQGGLAAVERLVADGVTVALGHSDATYEQAHRAVDAGVRVATHLFNAARPIAHREPGLVVALMEREEVTIELIADGVHLHQAVVRDVGRLARSRVALVTDAMAAAGAADGEYRLGPRRVRVSDGVARLVLDDGTLGAIAGSTLTLDRALRFAVQSGGLALTDAVHALTVAPARVLGRADIGRLAAGCRADLVSLDERLEVVAVMRHGAWQG
jgi:N-acetylglucosamine-6-phosphate deacetylase